MHFTTVVQLFFLILIPLKLTKKAVYKIKVTVYFSWQSRFTPDAPGLMAVPLINRFKPVNGKIIYRLTLLNQKINEN